MLPYLTQLEQTRHRLMIYRWVIGGCWVLTTIFLVAGCCMGLDYLLQFRSPNMRLLTTSTLVACSGWMIGRRFAGFTRVSSPQVALRLEEFYPGLGDRLASAVQFSALETASKLSTGHFDKGQANKGQPTQGQSGSADLRQAVLLGTTELIAGVQWSQLLPGKQLKRALFVVSLAMVAMATMAFFYPTITWIGASRLLNPMGHDRWPRSNHLCFIDPPNFAAEGESLMIRLRAESGVLPEEVWIHTRNRGDLDHQGLFVSRDTKRPMRRVGNVMEASLKVGENPFEIRATGGDDLGMSWHRVQVAARPNIESIQVTVVPPPYTGRAKTDLSPPYRVLFGSRIEVKGKFFEPLKSVRLVVHPKSYGHNAPVSLMGVLSDDRRSFRIGARNKSDWGWLAEESGSYVLEVTTQAGWTTLTDWSIPLEVTLDKPPQVAWLEPLRDLQVVADAEIPVRVAASEDQGLREVLLAIRLERNGSSSQKSILRLYPLSRLEDTLLGERLPGPQDLEVPTSINLSDWELWPGDTLVIEAQAYDHFVKDGISSPQRGSARQPLRLQILSSEELLRLIQREQVFLRKRLSEALASQQALRDKLVQQWQTSKQGMEATGSGGSVGPGELLSWQRQVIRLLDQASKSRQRQGAVQKVEEVLEVMDYNQLTDLELQPILNRMRTDLIALARSKLTDLEFHLRSEFQQDLLRANNHSNSDSSRDSGTQSTRQTEILQGLQEALDRLEQMLLNLDHFDALEQLSRLLQRLEHDQSHLLQQSRENLAPWLSQDSIYSGDSIPGAVSPESVSWESTTIAQRQLARRLGEFIRQLESVARDRISAQPGVASRLSQVAKRARQQGVQITMQEAANQLSEHRLGLALSHQQQAIEELKQLGRQLAGKQPQEISQRNSPKDSSAESGDSEAKVGMLAEEQGNQLAGKNPAPHADRMQGGKRAEGPEPGSLRSLIHDLWGALPARKRQQILQPVREEYMPEYASDIGAYFRALAESQTERKMQNSGKQE